MSSKKMGCFLQYCLSVLFLLLLPGWAAADYATDRIIVKLQRQTTSQIASVNEDKSSYLINHYPFIHQLTDLKLRQRSVRKPRKMDSLPEEMTFVAHLLPGTEVEQAISALRSDPQVKYAEPVYLMRIHQPNDPDFYRQWNLDNNGGADINIIPAWLTTTGSSDVVIAVIDTGVDANHPDLSGQLVEGYDFVEEDSLPQDEDGHGTQVAGIIAAKTDNGIGIAGVCPGCRIMPLRVSADKLIPHDKLISAIAYAVEYGADIINISAGGPDYSAILQEAIRDAQENGAIIVASSGNEGNTVPLYPAAYYETIAVGATKPNDQRWEKSSYGTHLDLVAPGQDIFSTTTTLRHNPPYVSDEGTSFAAPQVSGVLGLLRTVYPGYKGEQLRDIILLSARERVDLAAEDTLGCDPFHGWGRLDADQALRTIPPSTPPAVPDGMGASNGTTPGAVMLTWNPTNGATSYHIYRAYAPDQEKTWIGFTAGTPRYEDLSTLSGQTYSYYYWVSARNAAGNSGYSEPPVEATILHSPNNVAASDGTYSDKVLITWLAVSGAVRYNVYASTAAHETGNLIGSADGTQFEHTTAVPTVPYYYRVTAVVNTGQESKLSEYDIGYRAEVSIPAPAWIDASGGYPLGIIVSWQSVPGATRYLLYRASSPSGQKSVRAYVSGTTYVDTGMPYNRDYYYWVKAQSSIGDLSPFSPYDSGFRGMRW
ncbi:MAG: S8 family serine peptidase [Candidatus Contendobacter sp.]|nr:S8 family serine peptidase [Candidatus Contendobacter sp.]